VHHDDGGEEGVRRAGGRGHVEAGLVQGVAGQGNSVDSRERKRRGVQGDGNDKPVNLKLDGTPVKFMGGTMAVKADGPHKLIVDYAGADGKNRRHNTFELSADGKTLTETDVTPAPQASTMSVKFHKM